METEVEKMPCNGVGAMERYGYTNRSHEEAGQNDKKAEFMNKEQLCRRENT